MMTMSEFLRRVTVPVMLFMLSVIVVALALATLIANRYSLTDDEGGLLMTALIIPLAALGFVLLDKWDKRR